MKVDCFLALVKKGVSEVETFVLVRGLKNSPTKRLYMSHGSQNPFKKTHKTTKEPNRTITVKRSIAAAMEMNAQLVMGKEHSTSTYQEMVALKCLQNKRFLETRILLVKDALKTKKTKTKHKTQ